MIKKTQITSIPAELLADVNLNTALISLAKAFASASLRSPSSHKSDLLAAMAITRKNKVITVSKYNFR